MKKTTLFLSTCFVALIMLATSCKEDEKTTTPTPAVPTLYDRVGGTAMVADPVNAGQMIEKGRLTLRAVVDSSILVIAADAQLAQYFPTLFAELGAGNTTGLAALSESFTDFMCAATGSKNANYAYTGRSMKDAHDPAKYNRMGLKADKADFDKFVGNIGVGLAKNGVTSANNKQLVDDLVALLYTTQSSIVQR
jgi:hypothetical protein